MFPATVLWWTHRLAMQVNMHGTADFLHPLPRSGPRYRTVERATPEENAQCGQAPCLVPGHIQGATLNSLSLPLLTPTLYITHH